MANWDRPRFDGRATARAGTVRVNDILPGQRSSGPSELTDVGATLYFAADDGVSGTELWTSDGSEAGTVMARDILPGFADSFPLELVAAGDALFLQRGRWEHGPGTLEGCAAVTRQ